MSTARRYVPEPLKGWLCCNAIRVGLFPFVLFSGDKGKREIKDDVTSLLIADGRTSSHHNACIHPLIRSFISPSIRRRRLRGAFCLLLALVLILSSLSIHTPQSLPSTTRWEVEANQRRNTDLNADPNADANANANANSNANADSDKTIAGKCKCDFD